MRSTWRDLRVAVLRDEVSAARAELVELRTERDALMADIHDLQAVADELMAERDDLRTELNYYRDRQAPTVTAAANGRHTINWPNPRPQSVEVASDLLQQMVDTRNSLLTERDDWQARAHFYADLLMADESLEAELRDQYAYASRLMTFIVDHIGEPYTAEECGYVLELLPLPPRHGDVTA